MRAQRRYRDLWRNLAACRRFICKPANRCLATRMHPFPHLRRRRDYVGGANHFAPLDLLNHPEALARRIREALHV